MADITVPLTEIEKAQLLETCQSALNPEGITMLRRVLFQDDVQRSTCIACPVEVRGLYAVAFNLLNLRSDPDRWNRKIGERLAELEAAVKQLTPIVDKHFADKHHG